MIETMDGINAYLASLSDAELMGRMEVAVTDIYAASRDCPNTDWHDCCFAGAVLFAQEMNRRGLKRSAQPIQAP